MEECLEKSKQFEELQEERREEGERKTIVSYCAPKNVKFCHKKYCCGFRRRVAMSTTLDEAVGPSRLDRPELQIAGPEKSEVGGS